MVGADTFLQLSTYLCKNKWGIKLEANVAMLNSLNRGRAAAVHAWNTQQGGRHMSWFFSILPIDTALRGVLQAGTNAPQIHQ